MTENKIIIETSDKSKRIEFTEKDFNEFKHLTLTKFENGIEKEVRVIKFTPKKKIIMN